MVRGVPWFSLRDVGDGLGLSEFGLDQVNAAGFPAYAKMVVAEEADPAIPGDPEDQIVLSPVGVWHLTTFLSDPGRGQHLANWAKKEAALLCPSPAPGDPAVFLRLLEVNGRKELPPYPWKYSGRRSEWHTLRDSDDWLYAQIANRGLTLKPRRVLNGRPGVPEIAATA
ncbi:hypothetical protein KRR38_25115 [Novosphingobium sp. G106]|uniref:hypothetical protein n=1 Tax=Novosphingobium sp. G106 TaxID=2849500 RepID=UPI001C2CD70F|nr:hypothetical protein [Novosphingobium sp. G106]MBV1690869.1 hypothetical protein [Novosphingobium sp. G106]